MRRGGVVDGDGGAVTVADGDVVRCGGDDGAGPSCCVMPTAAATVSFHVAACAVARLKVIATVSRKWREQQVGTKRLSHRVC